VLGEVGEQYGDIETDVISRTVEPVSEPPSLLTYLEREGEIWGDKLAWSR